MKRFSSLLPLYVSLVLGGGCVGPTSVVEVQNLKEEIIAGETQQLSKLLQALESRDPEVREAAVRALADLGEEVIPALQATVRKENDRSGPALLALGLMGDPVELSFIRQYKRHTKLGGSARQAERMIEEDLLQRSVEQKDVEAMNAYVEFFPEGVERQRVEALREDVLAEQAYARIQANPTPEGMRDFIKQHPDSRRVEEVRQELVRRLFADVRSALERNEYSTAHNLLKEAEAADPRRSGDVAKLKGEAYLREGDWLSSQGDITGAVDVWRAALELPETRQDAERRIARAQLDEVARLFKQGKLAEAVARADQAVATDPALKEEVSRLKSEQIQLLLPVLDDPNVDHIPALRSLLQLGTDAVRPLEVYLGNLFVRKDYKLVEEVMTVLSMVLGPPGVISDEPQPIAAVRVRDSLSGFIRAGFTTAITEVSRLFSAPDFRAGWRPNLEPLDPRTTPLVTRTLETTSKYLGLLRLGLGFRALLGEQGMEVISGNPVKEDVLRQRVRGGDIGNNEGDVLLTRVQLAGTYASALAPLLKIARENPRQVLDFAVGLNVPPTTPDDWMTMAEGVANFSRQTVSGQNVGVITLWDGSTHTTRIQLVEVEADPRQVTLSVYDPVVDGLTYGTPDARAQVEARTLALTVSIARLTWGLYPGIGAVTVMLGNTSAGRFEPQTRYVLERKGVDRIDVGALRSLGGYYGPAQAELLSVRWTRWGGAAK